MSQRLRADLERYYRYQTDPGSRWQRLKTILATEAVWALVLFRLGQYLREEAPSTLWILLRLPYQVVVRAVRLIVGIHLYPQTRIGPGLYIGHYGGIWIAPGAVLGANCSLSHGVTIGIGGSNRRGTPVLGDCVWVGPNATISGPLRVGSGAVIAANSLVTSDIPENGVAVGVPARVVSYSGSAKLLALPGEVPTDLLSRDRP